MGGGHYPHGPVSMRPPDACPLCALPLGEPSVAVKGGGRAHLACAERQAAAAWRRRRRRALCHLALIALSLLALTTWAGPSITLFVVGLAWAALHTRLHRHYWHYTIRDLRRALRRRGEKGAS